MLYGSLINAVLIIAGSFIGLILRKGLPEKLKSTIMQGMSLAVILVGFQMALKSEDILVVIFSLGLGALIGELVDIEEKLENLGKWIEKKFSNNSKDDFARAFVTSSLVYCVGAMAIMGALQSGLEGTHETLIAKGMIDGITSIVFTSTLGIGVMFSAVPVLIYQGGITLLAGWLNQFLSPKIILEMSAVGGLLIAAIGFNILGMVKIRVGNLLPSIFLPIIIMQILNLF
ncbi:MAG: DUF554 domain-containing protein [Clostridia bacterium]